MAARVSEGQLWINRHLMLTNPHLMIKSSIFVVLKLDYYV